MQLKLEPDKAAGSLSLRATRSRVNDTAGIQGFTNPQILSIFKLVMQLANAS
jgi:hypothetical protein